MHVARPSRTRRYSSSGSRTGAVRKIRAFAASVDQVVVVEEVEPLLETEIRRRESRCWAGDPAAPGELAPSVLKPAIARLLGESVPEPEKGPRLSAAACLPRPPTMCVACPHLGVYYTLSQLRNVTISGDIGCYTLGASHPWNALDACISMGASMGMALACLDKGRGETDGTRRSLP